MPEVAASLWHRFCGSLHQRMVKVSPIFCSFFRKAWFALSLPLCYFERGVARYPLPLHFLQKRSADSGGLVSTQEVCLHVSRAPFCLLARLIAMYPSCSQALADLSLGSAAFGYWPGTGSLLLIKLLVQIFPSTDFRCVQHVCFSLAPLVRCACTRNQKCLVSSY